MHAVVWYALTDEGIRRAARVAASDDEEKDPRYSWRKFMPPISSVLLFNGEKEDARFLCSLDFKDERQVAVTYFFKD